MIGVVSCLTSVTVARDIAPEIARQNQLILPFQFPNHWGY